MPEARQTETGHERGRKARGNHYGQSVRLGNHAARRREPSKAIEIGFDALIISAHRTPDRLYQFAKDAAKNGFKVIIAGAGGAAHLPGMTAAMTRLPVLGVPVGIKSPVWPGQPPSRSCRCRRAFRWYSGHWAPGAVNAALLAAAILALSDAGPG